MTLRPRLLQRAAEPEAEAARLIDDMHRVPSSQQPLDPRHELRRRKPARRSRHRVIVLGDDDINFRVNVQPELDRGEPEASIGCGRRGCGRPFVMNNRFINHKAGELPNSPASFHAIYALQRTGSVRHGPCFRPRRSTGALPSMQSCTVAGSRVIGVIALNQAPDPRRGEKAPNFTCPSETSP